MMQDKVREIVHSLNGRKVTKAQSGIGTFLTIDFSLNVGESINGQSKLWVRYAAWRLEKRSEVLLGHIFNEDFQNEADRIVGELNGLKVIRADSSEICNDLIIVFEKEYVLRTFTHYVGPDFKGLDSWEIFTPNDYVLEVGPGTRAVYVPDDAPCDY